MLFRSVLAWRFKPETIGDYLRLSTDSRSARSTADQLMRRRSLDPGAYYHATVFADIADPVTNEFLRQRLGTTRVNAIYAQLVPAALWAVLEETALDECVRFASNILADEAEKDNCELSPINVLGDGAALEAVVRKLDGAKLGVALQDGRLSPKACLAVSLSWLAKSKAKGRK